MNKVFNFAKSAFNHAMNGFVTVNDDVYNKRITLCKSCENFNNQRETCNLCGCFVEIKTKWPMEQCPIHKWLQESINTSMITTENDFLAQNTKSNQQVVENPKDCGCNKNV